MKKKTNQHQPKLSVCGLVEQCRTVDHQTVSSSPTSTNVSVSLGKIYTWSQLLPLPERIREVLIMGNYNLTVI